MRTYLLLFRSLLPFCFSVAFKRSIFLLVLLSSHSASADFYYWYYDSVTTGKRTSATAACDALIANTSKPLGTPNSQYRWDQNITMTSTTQAKCSYKYNITYSDGSYNAGAVYNGSNVNIFRVGTSCAVGTTYNTLTGACDAPPPPVCKVGELFPSKGTTGPVITSNGRSYVVSEPQTMCKDQCEYKTLDARPSSCYGTVGADGWCNFVIKSTGVNCPADLYTLSQSGPPLNAPDTPNVPPSTPDDPICPKGWAVSNGTCFKLPPKFCDPTTGEICAPGTTDPNATNPDPGTGGNPGTPAEGTEGRPDSSSGADKDLQDLLDSKVGAEPCKPFADGSGCEGSTVKGEQCDKVIECTGDAVQCSILRQQKKMACAYEYEEARPFIEQQIAKDAYDLPTETVDGSALFTAGLNAPRWLPQGCPAPKAINITGISTSLSFEPACDFARTLGPLFVALASIFFAVYVGRAFGGN